MRSMRKGIAPLIALALVAAACGGDDEEEGGGTATASEPAETASEPAETASEPAAQTTTASLSSAGRRPMATASPGPGLYPSRRRRLLLRRLQLWRRLAVDDGTYSRLFSGGSPSSGVVERMH